MAFSMLSGIFSSTSSGFGGVTIGPPLEPRLKPGQNATEDDLPAEFDTKVGRLRIPRQKNPPPPTPDMITDARNGRLDRQFRLGKLIRASDFVGDVIPTTAVLTLSNIYDYQTRPLSVHDRVTEEQKTIRNLYYIALQEDELPAYHFWISPEDPDPVESQGVDWSKEFEKNPPSPRTAARIAELENDGHARAQTAQTQDDQGQSSDEDEEPSGGKPTRRGENLAIIKAMQDAEAKRDAKSQELFDQHAWRGMLKSSVAPGPPEAPYTTVPAMKPEDVRAMMQKIQEVERKEKEKAGSDSTSTPINKAKTAKIAPKGAHVLLQCRKGGMFLTDFTNKALVETAKRLVENEEKHPAEDKDGRMFIDIRQPNVQTATEYQVSSHARMARSFAKDIKPCFDKPGFDFQIRSLSMKGQSFFDKSKFDPTALKVARVGLGYFYVHASWGEVDDTMDNSRAFEYALNFFFPHDYNSRTPPKALVLEIPGHGSFDIDRSADPALNAKVQQIFAALTGSHTSRSPPEVFIHRMGEIYEQSESEDVGALSNSPIFHGGRHLPPVPPFPKTLPTNPPNDMATLTSTFQQVQAAGPFMPTAGRVSPPGPFYCPYCDEEGYEDMAQCRTREDLKDHIDQLHGVQTLPEPAQRECPFEYCHDMLETNGSHPRYFLNQSHLNSHFNGAIAEERTLRTQELERMAKDRVRIAKELEQTKKDYDQMTKERYRIAKERDVAISRLTKERDTAQTAIFDMTKGINDQLEARQPRPRVNQETQTSPRPEGQTNAAPQPRSQASAASQPPSQADEPKKLWYCDMCRTSVNSLDQDKKEKHAAKCKTTVADFLYMTPKEAKIERTKPKKKPKSTAATKKVRQHDQNDEALVIDGRTRSQKRKADDPAGSDPQGCSSKRAKTKE